MKASLGCLTFLLGLIGSGELRAGSGREPPTIARPSSSAPAAVAPAPISVTVDGVPMAFYASGSRGPTIVLEAGSGGDHHSWLRVQPRLAAIGCVVSYDRLDYGASGRSPRPRTAVIIAEQLRDGLTRAGFRPPYLLVGHSYGGALIRVFAARYPDDIVGLVLVDPAQEGFYLRAGAEAPGAYLAQLEEDLAFADARASEALRREYLAYETSMAQARQARPVAEGRIVLLSATQMELAEPLRAIWLDEQAAWAARAGARLIRVNSGHDIPRRRPEAVVEAVRSLMPAAAGAASPCPTHPRS